MGKLEGKFGVDPRVGIVWVFMNPCDEWHGGCAQWRRRSGKHSLSDCFGQSAELGVGAIRMALALQGSLRGDWAAILWEARKIIDIEKLGESHKMEGLVWKEGKERTQ